MNSILVGVVMGFHCSGRPRPECLRGMLAMQCRREQDQFLRCRLYSRHYNLFLQSGTLRRWVHVLCLSRGHPFCSRYVNHSRLCFVEVSINISIAAQLGPETDRFANGAEFAAPGPSQATRATPAPAKTPPNAIVIRASTAMESKPVRPAHPAPSPQ